MRAVEVLVLDVGEEMKTLVRQIAERHLQDMNRELMALDADD